MFDWIIVNVIHMHGVVGLVTNGMFPKAPLPYSLFGFHSSTFR